MGVWGHIILGFVRKLLAGGVGRVVISAGIATFIMGENASVATNMVTNSINAASFNPKSIGDTHKISLPSSKMKKKRSAKRKMIFLM